MERILSVPEPGPPRQPEPRLGCGAAIVQSGRILLIQRLRPPEAGHWGLPGGKVDFLEPVEDAVRREVAEELAIRLLDLELLCIVDQIDKDAKEHWVAPAYLSTRFEGEPALAEPDKHAAFGWFPLTALPQPLTTPTLAAVKALKRRTANAPAGRGERHQ